MATLSPQTETPPVVDPVQGNLKSPSPDHPALPPQAPQEVHTLPEAPTFHRFQEYNHRYKIALAGFSYTVETSGKRGCVRFEVEQGRRSQLLISTGGATLERTVENLTSPDGATSSRQYESLTHKLEPDRLNDKLVESYRAADGTASKRVTNTHESAGNRNQRVVETTTARDGTVKERENIDMNVNVSGVGGGLGGSWSREYSTQVGQPEHATLKCKYVVMGLFSRVNGVPRERLIEIKTPKRLFFYIWFSIISLRGIDAIFSLKDVRGFAIYQVRDPM